jgi:hypothetical protein
MQVRLLTMFHNGSHMVPADYVLRDIPYGNIMRYYHNIGHTIILLCDPDMSCHEVLTAAERVRPDEIILPDVPGNAEGTIRAWRAFPRHKLGRIRIAYVPQGNTMDEWMGCASAIYPSSYEDAGIHTVVMSTGSCSRFCQSRAELYNQYMRVYGRMYHVHILGMMGRGIEEIQELRRIDTIGCIDGISSMAHITNAQWGLHLGLSNVGHTYRCDMEVDLRMAEVNYYTITKACIS